MHKYKVWYHVCKVAWLKITKSCPCLSYFPGLLGHFEGSTFFQKWGDKPHTKAVKEDLYNQFLTLSGLGGGGGGGLRGSDGQTHSCQSEPSYPMMLKLGDLYFLSVRHLLAKF